MVGYLIYCNSRELVLKIVNNRCDHRCSSGCLNLFGTSFLWRWWIAAKSHFGISLLHWELVLRFPLRINMSTGSPENFYHWSCTVRPGLSSHVGTGSIRIFYERLGRICELCPNKSSSVGFIHAHCYYCMLLIVFITNCCLSWFIWNGNKMKSNRILTTSILFWARCQMEMNGRNDNIDCKIVVG